MKRHIRHAGCVGAALTFIMAAGWAAAAQTEHAAPASQGTPGVANPVQGFSQNSDQPIKIESTSLEVRDKDHIATFIGNVHVVQGDTTMRCKTLVVFYDQSPGAAPAPKGGQTGSSNQQIKRLEAKGVHVSVPQVVNHDDSPMGVSRELHPGVFVRSVYFRDPNGIMLEFAALTRELGKAEDIRHAPAHALQPASA